MEISTRGSWRNENIFKYLYQSKYFCASGFGFRENFTLPPLRTYASVAGLWGVVFSEHEWQELERLVEILRIPYDCTLALQSEKLTPGKCFLEWRQVLFKLQKHDSVLASSLAAEIQSQEKNYWITICSSPQYGLIVALEFCSLSHKNNMPKVFSNHSTFAF